MKSRLAIVLPFMVLGGLASTASAQTSHRQLDPKPRCRPNALEQLERQGEEDTKERVRQQMVSREAREAARAELEQDLSRLIELAKDLKSRLETLDANTIFPADLSRQAEELDRLARHVRQRIRKL
jgi:hypothetical protein